MITKLIGTKSEMVLVTAVLLILLGMFIPLPAALLDILLITNCTFAMAILILSMATDKPLSFSTFPSILLIATLFRLALNIASTRLILSHGDAGAVIQSVGHYVVGGNFVIGLVVFFILVVIQYVVITNGAQRVSEVAARFVLDSMPGKQMSIDADLNMGIIDDETAQNKRNEIQRESSFYGAMDGASKFVKGDAIAGIIIIFINIVGGLIIGKVEMEMTWMESFHTFTLLTVGDGIITQIPALIISTATGIIVTRAATDANIGQEIAMQFSRHPKVFLISLLVLFLVAWVPGIHLFSVIVVATPISIGLWYSLQSAAEHSNQKDERVENAIEDKGEAAFLNYPDIELSIPFSTPESSKQLLREQLNAIRRTLTHDQGIILPDMMLNYESNLKSTFELRVLGMKVSEGALYWDRVLYIPTRSAELDNLEGDRCLEPTYGIEAIWIENDKVNTITDGSKVVPIQVLTTNVREKIKLYLHQLYSEKNLNQHLEIIINQHKELIDFVRSEQLGTAQLLRVCRLLLKERISLRCLSTIIEALRGIDCKGLPDEQLIDQLRARIGPILVDGLVTPNRVLHAITLAPQLEQSLLNVDAGSRSNLEHMKRLDSTLQAISPCLERMIAQNMKAVIVCTSPLRRRLSGLVRRSFPFAAVLSIQEIPDDVLLKSAHSINV